MYITTKYINPFTDFGFKRIFGSEESKPLLISFLNDLLDIESPIIDLEYKNLDNTPYTIDTYCKLNNNDSIIISLSILLNKYELNNPLARIPLFLKDKNITFADLSLNYPSNDFPFNFHFIQLLNFNLHNDKRYLSQFRLFDIQTKKEIYDRLTIYQIELPKLKKDKKELSNHLEKWLWFFNQLETLQEIPEVFKGDENFKKAFHLAELAQMTPGEKISKAYSDYTNALDIAIKKEYEKGIQKGMKEGEKKAKIKIAKNLLDILDNETISKKTGLTIQEIENLRK